MIMIKILILAIVIIIMGNSCFIIFIACTGLHGQKYPIYNDAELTMKEMIDICVFGLQSRAPKCVKSFS